MMWQTPCARYELYGPLGSHDGRAIRSAHLHGLAPSGTRLALPPVDGRALGLNMAATGLYTCNIAST